MSLIISKKEKQNLFIPRFIPLVENLSEFLFGYYHEEANDFGIFKEIKTVPFHLNTPKLKRTKVFGGGQTVLK